MSELYNGNNIKCYIGTIKEYQHIFCTFLYADDVCIMNTKYSISQSICVEANAFNFELIVEHFMYSVDCVIVIVFPYL